MKEHEQPMDVTTLKALRNSIAHWKRMVRNPHGDDMPVADQCALCAIFHTEKGCDGCPIKMKTGRNYCSGTSYGAASVTHFEGRWDDFKVYAGRMVTELESLLPKPNECAESCVSVEPCPECS